MFAEYRLIPEELNIPSAHRREIENQYPSLTEQSYSYQVVRRNIDARARQVYFVLRSEIIDSENQIVSVPSTRLYKQVNDAERIYIIGSGPCGYFAALECLEVGLKPIIYERGKDAQTRRKDLRSIQQEGKVNANSNYCFGEGGAGTYSDGKLYTRSGKRGNIHKVLDILVDHGAHPDILIDAHPHIGSNKLPIIIQNIRKTIEEFGGEIHFNSLVEDIEIANQKIKSIRVNDEDVPVQKLIIAAGHSARELFYVLHHKKIKLECKEFALGVRIEHPQSYIDQMQYRQVPRSTFLPAASYSLSCSVGKKGVFSFCMCPGGLMVPAATSPGEIVINGMSLSRRDSAFANSGLVTSVDNQDFEVFNSFGEMRGLEFQKNVEKTVFSHSDGTQRAPAQRVIDFLKNTRSNELPASSYIPGLISISLRDVLPAEVILRLHRGLEYFGKKQPGYLHPESVLVATESRTSSPIRIPRKSDSFEHVDIKGIYPAGEGAGYAGGILSAAMDGQKVVRAIFENLTR